MIQWLHFAAAPTFAAMAFVTAAQDRGLSLCSSGDGLGQSGMRLMYLLMAFFHLAPWLKLMSRRTSAATLFPPLDRSGDVRTTEQ